MKIPKVFVSYSHDSQDHKKWVLEFATRLRNNGIDAILDQWDLRPGDDLPHFMETHLAASERVLMVCTDRYVQKANAGSGGVGYEKMIITADLMRTIDSNKVIPVIRQSGTCTVPTFLQTKLFIDLSRDDQFEFGFDELARAVHGAPLFIKPPVGNNPFTVVAGSPTRNGDAVRELMQLVVDQFENQTTDYVKYSLLVMRANISRIMLDAMITIAVEEGLLTRDKDRDVWLTDKGKHYAIQHKLVE